MNSTVTVSKTILQDRIQYVVKLPNGDYYLVNTHSREIAIRYACLAGNVPFRSGRYSGVFSFAVTLHSTGDNPRPGGDKPKGPGQSRNKKAYGEGGLGNQGIRRFVQRITKTEAMKLLEKERKNGKRKRGF